MPGDWQRMQTIEVPILPVINDDGLPPVIPERKKKPSKDDFTYEQVCRSDSRCQKLIGTKQQLAPIAIDPEIIPDLAEQTALLAQKRDEFAKQVAAKEAAKKGSGKRSASSASGSCNWDSGYPKRGKRDHRYDSWNTSAASSVKERSQNNPADAWTKADQWPSRSRTASSSRAARPDITSGTSMRQWKSRSENPSWADEEDEDDAEDDEAPEKSRSWKIKEQNDHWNAQWATWQEDTDRRGMKLAHDQYTKNHPWGEGWQDAKDDWTPSIDPAKRKRRATSRTPSAAPDTYQ